MKVDSGLQSFLDDNSDDEGDYAPDLIGSTGNNGGKP
ncbi:unnamed protein product, partial [Allacma fusca]